MSYKVPLQGVPEWCKNDFFLERVEKHTACYLHHTHTYYSGEYQNVMNICVAVPVAACTTQQRDPQAY